MSNVTKENKWGGTLAIALAGVVVGMLLSRGGVQRPLHASSAHGSKNVSVATMEVDGRSEAVVTLEHKTSQLHVRVIDSKTRKYFAHFMLKDLDRHMNVPAGRQAIYGLATGTANFAPGANAKLADGVIYVTEEITGQVAAFAIPWNAAFGVGGNRPFRKPEPLVKLDIAKISTVVRRPAGGAK